MTAVVVTPVVMATLLGLLFWSMSRCRPGDCQTYFQKEALPPSLVGAEAETPRCVFVLTLIRPTVKLGCDHHEQPREGGASGDGQRDVGDVEHQRCETMKSLSCGRLKVPHPQSHIPNTDCCFLKAVSTLDRWTLEDQRADFFSRPLEGRQRLTGGSSSVSPSANE